MIHTIKQFINSHFWRLSDSKKQMNSFEYKADKPFYSCPIPKSNTKIQDSFAYDNTTWDHAEYAIQYKHAYIESECGYILEGMRTINSFSIIAKDRLPSVSHYIKKRFRKPICISDAILFDCVLANNHFHFFSDVVTKLFLLQRYNIATTTVLIGKEIYTYPLFQYYLQTDFFSKFTWIQLDTAKNYIGKNLWVVRPQSYDKSLWLQALHITPIPHTLSHPRIFLYRNKKSGRNLINNTEIKAFLESYNFTAIDAGELSIQDQISLFSSAHIVVAIHGAGITNMLFSYHNNPTLLELIPENRIACQYYWMSHMLGYTYAPILGTALVNNEFEVSLSELKKTLLQIL